MCTFQDSMPSLPPFAGISKPICSVQDQREVKSKTLRTKSIAHTRTRRILVCVFVVVVVTIVVVVVAIFLVGALKATAV